ncbi:ras-related protein Rab-21 isoform X1 [Drosophila santomea]|uniref:ras-related protein Rab-21 isoform X1 n=2 Tax=Drosophila santomea TaxID=129105 RepID=UPI00195475A9|nr:ras-related protein Rab-21 isoform X1 [Drosophila santomea]XP_039498711.1 ras-related protein Rab-21 isoform X1 [Drosophila santomea]
MSSSRTRNGPTLNFKAVLLGEGCVGKTSLVLRYMEDRFNAQHLSTLQASFVTRKLSLEDGRRAQLNIWDTAGQERFHALGPIYYRGSDGALLVHDITDRDSFQKVKSWVRELRQMRGTEIALIIVGNKTDLEEQRSVTHDEALQYARTVGAQYVETSAKENEGVANLFELLTHLMLEQLSQRQPDASPLRLQTSDTDTLNNSEDSEAPDPGDPAGQRSCCGI